MPPLRYVWQGRAHRAAEMLLNTGGTLGQRCSPGSGEVTCSPAGVFHRVNGSLALLLPPLHIGLWRWGCCQQWGLPPPSSQLSGMEHLISDHHDGRHQCPPAPATPLPHQSRLSVNTQLPCLAAFAQAGISAWHTLPSGPHMLPPSHHAGHDSRRPCLFPSSKSSLDLFTHSPNLAP